MGGDYDIFNVVARWWVNGHSVELVRSPTTGKERLMVPKPLMESGDVKVYSTEEPEGAPKEAA